MYRYQVFCEHIGCAAIRRHVVEEIRKLLLLKPYRHRSQKVPIYFTFEFQTQHVSFVYPLEAAILRRKTEERYRVNAARNDVEVSVYQI
jgi:hypothetical protein